jgi:hypothetical protein
MNNNSETIFFGCLAGVGVYAAMFIAVLFLIKVFDQKDVVFLSAIIGLMAITFLVYLVQLFRRQKNSLAIGMVTGLGIPVLMLIWFVSLM